VETIRHLLDQYQGRMMIGEIYLPVHQLVTYYGKNNNGAHLPFNFLLLSLSWDPLQIAAAIDEYEAALPPDAWPNWVIGNHDKGRITGRVGFEQSRIAAVLLLTLRGTPTIYYGDEIAMRDVPVPSSEIQDPQGLLMPKKHLSRDPERSPMQWDDTENAGFTKGKPWLRLDKSYRRRCVLVEQGDPYSMLSLYARLIQLRGEEPSLTRGHYTRVHADHQTFIYKRQAQGYDGFLIALNFSHRPSYYQGSARDIAGIVEFSVDCELDGSLIEDQINLDGDQGIIVRLASPGVIHE
jgi:alpha-glucosidase